MKAISLGLVIMLLLSACSQDSIFEGISSDSGRDSKLYQAQIDLDNSDFDQVISDLSTMYTTASLDSKVSKLLASAYMGKAGVDVSTFLALATSSGLNPYDSMGFVIDSASVVADEDARYIKADSISAALKNISEAEYILRKLSDGGKASQDDKIQLGMASAAHFIMNVGSKTKKAVDSSRITIDAPINTTSLNQYSSYIGPTIFLENGNISSFQNDLINLNEAVMAFKQAYPEDNPMRDIMDSFLYSALGLDPEETVTDELILSYTSTGLSNYIKSFAE